jgi:NAD(P)-dependent dehydrogenase (short-subunit alcohol dehydrogenase family)
MNLADRIAIVTGGGIGKQSALLLRESGYSVLLAGRRIEPLELTVQESGVGDSRSLEISVDVGDPEAVSALFTATEEKFGRLDVLFNNTGTGAPAIPLEDLSYEQSHSLLNICVTGTFLCTQHVLQIMKKQNPHGGRIINNGSVSAQIPQLNSAPYTAAKHAKTGLTKSIALDGRSFDINCGQMTTVMASRMPFMNHG